MLSGVTYASDNVTFVRSVAISATAAKSMVLRDNLEISTERLRDIGPDLPFAVVAGAIVIPALGTDRGFWQYSTFSDLVRVDLGALIVVLCATSATFAEMSFVGTRPPLRRDGPLVHPQREFPARCADRCEDVAHDCIGREDR